MVAQLVKNLPVMQETAFRFLGWEDPLEKGTSTHSSILAWRIPRTEEPGELQSRGSPRVRHRLSDFHFYPQGDAATRGQWWVPQRACFGPRGAFGRRCLPEGFQPRSECTALWQS